jgi:hypothetical protein
MKKILLILILLFFAQTMAFAVDYSKFNLSDINAINNATKTYQAEFHDKKGSKEAEQGYLEFCKFYNSAVNVQSKLKTESEQQFEYKAFEGSLQKQAQQYTKKYAGKGLAVQFDEGEFFIVDNHKYLYKNFAPYLPADWQTLLKFETRFDKRITSDARYIIPKSEVVSILKFYEKFDKKYPDFVDKNRIENLIKTYQEDLKHYPNLLY